MSTATSRSQRCCRPKRLMYLWRAKDRLACRFRLDGSMEVSRLHAAVKSEPVCGDHSAHSGSIFCPDWWILGRWGPPSSSWGPLHISQRPAAATPSLRTRTVVSWWSVRSNPPQLPASVCCFGTGIVCADFCLGSTAYLRSWSENLSHTTQQSTHNNTEHTTNTQHTSSSMLAR